MSPDLPWRLRLWLFLYGYPNLVGSLLGLAGLGLFFAGLIGPGWPLIVLGLYALGWVLAWQFAPGPEHLEIAREAHASALLEELEDIIRRVDKRLPKEAVQLLRSLRDTLAELLPRLAASPIFSQQTHSLEKTVRDYLPTTLENYLRLPPMFARAHSLDGGRTAQALLLEQLGLLNQAMGDMLADTLAQDARRLAENGRFLEQKFQPQDFLTLPSRAIKTTGLDTLD